MARIRGANSFHTADVTKNTEDEYIADTPVKTERIISIEIDTKADSEFLYSDDEIEEEVEGTVERTGKVELNYLSNETKVKILGGSIDANGVYFPPEEGAPKKHVALLFKAPTGNSKNKLMCYYDVTFKEPKVKMETSENKPKTQTVELEFTCYKNKFLGKHYCDLDMNGTDANSVIEEQWFSAVYNEIASTPATP